MSRRFALTAAATTLALAGCGDSGGSGDAAQDGGATQSSSAEPVPPATPKPTGTRIVAAESDYGTILFGPGHRAIYLFEAEDGPRAQCYGACAEAWPPVLTEGPPRAGDGVHQDLLGTARRRDGKTQATYAGHPLYYWQGDPPGEVYCQGADEFGGLWLVVQRSGEPLA